MATKKFPQCGTRYQESASQCICGYRLPPIETSTIGQPVVNSTQSNQKSLTKPPTGPVPKPNPEIQTAGDWYFWLWFSPILTIPTLFLLNPFTYGEYSEEVIPDFIVLGSALWHLILLYSVIKGRTTFIRWHGRQALLLAAIGTIVALGTVLSLYAGDYSTAVFGILLLIGLWLAGNLWGQRQARRGDCALMRWTGHAAGLPLLVKQQASPLRPAQFQPDAVLVDHPVSIIRINPDPAARRVTLHELEHPGLVESL